MVRLLIIDNPGLMRVAVRRILEAEPEIDILTPPDGEAISVEMVQRLNPDVILLMIDPPRINGVDLTRQIMKGCRRPIILVKGIGWMNNWLNPKIRLFLKSLESGAADHISWPVFQQAYDVLEIRREFLRKVLYWGRRTGQPYFKGDKGRPPYLPSAIHVPPRVFNWQRPVDLVVMSAGAGGIGILPRFLNTMGRLPCPVILLLCIPEEMLRCYAEYLHHETGQEIHVGLPGMVPRDGEIIVTNGENQSGVGRDEKGELTFHIRYQPGGKAVRKWTPCSGRWSIPPSIRWRWC